VDLPKTQDLVFLTPNSADAERLSAALGWAWGHIHRASTLWEAAQLLTQTDASVLVADAVFPGGNWKDVVEFLSANQRGVTLVLAANDADERFWAEILNWGAYDLLLKPFEAAESRRVLRNAISFAVTRRRPLPSTDKPRCET